MLTTLEEIHIFLKIYMSAFWLAHVSILAFFCFDLTHRHIYFKKLFIGPTSKLLSTVSSITFVTLLICTNINEYLFVCLFLKFPRLLYTFKNNVS